MAETLATVALERLMDALVAPNSDLRLWVDEVSEPPPDLSVEGETKYTGILCVIRNRIKRAFVMRHARQEKSQSLGSLYSDHESQYHYEDDEFPGFD